jgi:hypothetical protein
VRAALIVPPCLRISSVTRSTHLKPLRPHQMDDRAPKFDGFVMCTAIFIAAMSLAAVVKLDVVIKPGCATELTWRQGGDIPSPPIPAHPHAALGRSVQVRWWGQLAPYGGQHGHGAKKRKPDGTESASSCDKKCKRPKELISGRPYDGSSGGSSGSYDTSSDVVDYGNEERNDDNDAATAKATTVAQEAVAATDTTAPAEVEAEAVSVLSQTTASAAQFAEAV